MSAPITYHLLLLTIGGLSNKKRAEVVNFVTGSGSVAGNELSKNPKIGKCSIYSCNWRNLPL